MTLYAPRFTTTIRLKKRTRKHMWTWSQKSYTVLDYAQSILEILSIEPFLSFSGVFIDFVFTEEKVCLLRMCPVINTQNCFEAK